MEQNGEVLQLKDLAGELNGCGGTHGVEELKAPIGQVKNGHVEAGFLLGGSQMGLVGSIVIFRKKRKMPCFFLNTRTKLDLFFCGL